MKKIRVTTPALAKAFREMPARIYRDDPEYIRPLDKDIEAVFDPKQNKFFQDGECERWLFIDEHNAYIGRLAVFHTPKYAQEQATGGIGFFECIPNKAIAHAMFDEAKAWLQIRGMEAMDGPINFGERDKWWGLLLNGFIQPLYGMNYNPPYYREFFESYGFQLYFNQYCYGMEVNKPLNEKHMRVYNIYANKPDFEAVKVKKNELNRFADAFCTIYNKAWAAHPGDKQMEPAMARNIFAQMKPILDEDIAWFVYYKNEPIAMWLNLPDLNQYFRHFNGRFGLLEKLKFLYLRFKGECTRFVGVVYGVVPEWQGRGTDAYMIGECHKTLHPNPRYEKFEMQWIGDFNPKMMNLAKGLGATEVRHFATYRYLFDRTKPFERHPILE
ncbi:MAG: hypothetical protein FGM54_04380 [Chitinophagaceae bacterium]|nr:hypothetical protein [Chitinophagaceae bacterium]